MKHQGPRFADEQTVLDKKSTTLIARFLALFLKL